MFQFVYSLGMYLNCIYYYGKFVYDEKNDSEKKKFQDGYHPVYVQWMYLEIIVMKSWILAHVVFIAYHQLSHHFGKKNRRFHNHKDISKQIHDFMEYFKPQMDWACMCMLLVFIPIFTIGMT